MLEKSAKLVFRKKCNYGIHFYNYEIILVVHCSGKPSGLKPELEQNHEYRSWQSGWTPSSPVPRPPGK